MSAAKTIRGPRLFDEETFKAIDDVFACLLECCTGLDPDDAKSLTQQMLETGTVTSDMLRHACSTAAWAMANLESRYTGVRKISDEEFRSVERVGLLHELPQNILSRFQLSPEEQWGIQVLRSNETDWRKSENRLLKKGLVKSADVACCAFLAHQQAELWDGFPSACAK